MQRSRCSACLSDQNRGNILEAGLPQAVVSLLEGYTDLVPAALQTDPLPLSIPHLQVIKTAVGLLLNASLGYGVNFIHMLVIGTNFDHRPRQVQTYIAGDRHDTRATLIRPIPYELLDEKHD